MLIQYFFFYFFSSRRRHTRLQGDWSSDVCSSDLAGADQAFHHRAGLLGTRRPGAHPHHENQATADRSEIRRSHRLDVRHSGPAGLNSLTSATEPWTRWISSFGSLYITQRDAVWC